MIFIDTNYFLRLIINDESVLHTKAKDFFLSAATNANEFMTSPLVLFEVYWVLKSFYKQTKEQRIATLQLILSMNFIELDDRQLLFNALTRFSSANLELEDCYHLETAKANQCDEIATFDATLLKEFRSTRSPIS